MLSSIKLKELIEATRQHINLTESVIEKDYYVTQTIHALSDTENDYFKLVFAGGTCLAKGHKIVQRMSEDIDFKIQIKDAAACFSKSRIIKELKEFRSIINSKLLIHDLTTDKQIVRNEGQYSRIQMNYPVAFSINAELRPHILLEFTVSEVRLEPVNLSINTIIEDTLSNVIITIPPTTACVSVEETAIEKWVGLTRRIIAIERGYYADDPTLVRHVYDLNAIYRRNLIKDSFFKLAQIVITNDAKQFKNQHPEYAYDPRSEITSSLQSLKNEPIWQSRYKQFIETMVYDKVAPPDYRTGIKILENISNQLIESLQVTVL